MFALCWVDSMPRLVPGLRGSGDLVFWGLGFSVGLGFRV